MASPSSRRRRRRNCPGNGRESPPATLSPASRTLVSQAQAQRRKGDLPGATVSLERALRIEPKNPLLWLEMGRLRMDQRNYLQAENMARKALSMSVGDDSTQSAAWRLIADSLRARDRNPEAEEAMEQGAGARTELGRRPRSDLRRPLGDDARDVADQTTGSGVQQRCHSILFSLGKRF